GRQRLSWKFLLDELNELFGLCGRQVALLVLGVGVKEQDLVVGNDVIVDDPGTPALSPTRQRPTNFTEALGPGNQVPGLRISHQCQLEFEHVVFGKQAGAGLLEEAEALEFHLRPIRQWRITARRKRFHFWCPFWCPLPFYTS